MKLRVKLFASNSNEQHLRPPKQGRSDKTKVKEAIQMKVEKIYKKITSDRSQSTKRPSEIRVKGEKESAERQRNKIRKLKRQN